LGGIYNLTGPMVMTFWYSALVINTNTQSHLFNSSDALSSPRAQRGSGSVDPPLMKAVHRRTVKRVMSAPPPSSWGARHRQSDSGNTRFTRNDTGGSQSDAPHAVPGPPRLPVRHCSRLQQQAGPSSSPIKKPRLKSLASPGESKPVRLPDYAHRQNDALAVRGPAMKTGIFVRMQAQLRDRSTVASKVY
jgi:hypothetical protein